MSFYTLAVYYWSALAALGLAAPVVALATQSAVRAIGTWVSGLHDDVVISSQHGPLSVP